LPWDWPPASLWEGRPGSLWEWPWATPLELWPKLNSGPPSLVSIPLSAQAREFQTECPEPRGEGHPDWPPWSRSYSVPDPRWTGRPLSGLDSPP
jgi:hypothetical protein